jgi:hypothetical protein
LPTIAEYTVIQDTAVTLPKTGGDIDHDYPTFSAPAVNTGSRSILAFRVDPKGTATLRVTLNGTVLLTQTFDTEPQRSWHEVVDANVLLASNNTLTIEKTGGSGSVTVSDVYLNFQANI